MDTGDYETNTLVVSNISTITFAFYEPAASSSSTLFSSGGNEIEAAFRKDGYLAFLDASRRGLWCFRLVIKGKSSTDLVDTPYFERNVESAGFMLSVTEEGTFEPAALVKHRFYGHNAANTPSSSSSSASSALDAAFRSAQSATTPSFPGSVAESDGKTVGSSDSKMSSSTSVRDVYECLLQASYSAITSCLSAKTGAVPLTSRTLLLPAVDQTECSTSTPILASLRIYLTTTGCLIVSLSHSFANSLITLSENITSQLPPLGVTVLAAPLGMFATCHLYSLTEATTTDASLGQSPDTQHRFRHERDEGPWRNLCSRLIQSRTASLSAKASQKFVGLQRLRRKLVEQNSDGKRTPMMGTAPNIRWPANLCFCKTLTNLSMNGSEELIGSQLEKSFDPLTAAKTWFSSSAEREAIISQKKKERDTLAVQEGALPEQQVQISNSLSPLASHRPTQSGILGSTMYPTPPQGVIGVTPSMDGTLSSPSNNLTAPNMAEMDAASHPPAELYGENWESTEIKRERAGTSFESENLFGELGPDMFGDNDITEADFSFFDQQPDGNIDLTSLDLATVPNANATPSLDVSLAASQVPPNKMDPPHISASELTPTFAKPELRHARSSLGDEPRRPVSDVNQTSNAMIKRPASPFNPDTVYKRIRASLDNHKATQQNSLVYANHNSIFDKVDFGPGLSLVNSKYEGSGRFDFSMNQSKATRPSNLETPATTDYLRRHGKGRKNLKELPMAYGELLIRMRGNQNSASNRPSPQHLDAPHSDADDMSLMSDQDDSSYDSDEPPSPVKSSSIRRRRGDDDGDSLATSFKDLEMMDAAAPHLPFELSRNSKYEIDIPLTKYFADPEPAWVQYSLPDDQFIMAAQILTDQVTASTLLSGTVTDSPLHSGVDRRRHLSNITRNAIKELQQGFPVYFQSTTGHQLRSFIELPDVPLLGQPTRLQPRPPGSDHIKPSNIFQIPSPRFEMRRYESRLSVLPSSISFWESLGLSPTHGTKDINAICLFPNQEGVSDSISVFTDRMRSTYESFKLGSFSRLSTPSGDEDGLFPFDLEKEVISFGKTTSFLGPSLQSCASRVCKALSTVSAEQMNFVIFFVYTPDVPGSIVECCAAFNEIFEGYKRILTNKKLPFVNEMALQLIPQNLVASSSSVPMPSPSDLSKLALEIYDRCTIFGGAMPSPAIMLEQALPRMIDFKLNPTPSTSVLHENSCLHLGYAQSIDERWITVAWTDNRGSQQMTTSYCLGRKGKNIATPLADVIHEIWSTTRELISSWKVNWRIIVAKCGVMDIHEIELWSSLVQPDPKSGINLTLVTVDTDPSLQLLPPAAKIPNNATSILYTTPGSTPQGATVSPEQSGNATTPFRDNATTSGQTPGGDNNATDSDIDATLTDTTDQTWGVILSHRLQSSVSLTDPNPVLVSGYLVKRSGVNIVHSENNPRAYEALLREMLTYYRGLGTLARTRGMIDKDTDIRPWHIAAAEKGVRALYMLM
ncbi:mediator complex subunit 13 C-terminal-domain-containing protein [Xylaria bambusicola]|uniref:mediator complex subunit 13 C-terminal-domain-containing protein n=1 Tax=Xylaria bambusicola TaxID=326684 RepID=UPI002007857A|nr:mediator complex subunit 13 C-terminal-domain-containing protein [Xylaria bambusicola]KAI0506069.1 mediator complex subunit 13 C-terminal-domain-containing protein [Xylaria bambusicola]